MSLKTSFKSVISEQNTPCLCETTEIFPEADLSHFELEKLSKTLQNDTLKIRIGKRQSEELQWETLCKSCEGTITEILYWNSIKDCCYPNSAQEKIQKSWGACCSEHYWCYADYMYMKDILKNHPQLLRLLKWGSLGFENKSGVDSTMWIGTPGAYTICHYDTYGCNIVLQVSGSKKWILFPPSDTENLYPTRIPYEESSVFSEVDLKNPDLANHPRFSKARACVVTLKPGEMLYVPHHWWHYVENLELSVSINLWYEVECDSVSRLDEAITRLIIGSSSHVPITSTISWFNPTEDPDSVKAIEENLNYVQQSVKEVQLKTHQTPEPEINFSKTVSPQIYSRNPGTPITITPLSLSNYVSTYITDSVPRAKILRHDSISRNIENFSYTDFIQCLTHPDVVKAVSKVLQDKFS